MQEREEMESAHFDLEVSSSGRVRGFRSRRRNRHGRGLRGELMLPALPGSRTRSERFDELVLESAERLQDAGEISVDGVMFAVEEIPPGLEDLVRSGTPAPLGSHTPAQGQEPPRVTVYRRVVVQNCIIPEELPFLIRQVVVEQTAELLGVSPDSIDPDFRGRGRY